MTSSIEYDIVSADSHVLEPRVSSSRGWLSISVSVYRSWLLGMVVMPGT